MRTTLFILTILIAASVPIHGAEAATADSCSCDNVSKTHWISQLFHNNFRLNDSAICYPAFPRFALKVYNWGDKTFNSYDPDYVIGTGKNWKLMGKSYNWMETSTLLFPEDATLDMHSTLFSDAGFRLSFMAVSIGYMWNMNKIFSHPTSRHTFDFAFTTSRFSLSYQYLRSEGGMILTRLGDYMDGHSFRYHFDDVNMESKSVEALFFFNPHKYSHAAAYSYSKYQLRSAGTALVGFNFVEQKIQMDFSGLPTDMLYYLPLENPLYNSHYCSYNLSGGYSYNWVLKPRKWLINGYGTVAMGYRRLFGTREGHDFRSLISNNFNLNLAAVYNHRALFAAFTAKIFGYFNYNTRYTHFNTYPSFTLIVGMRF
ncbi:MAG: DUF4421 domain-containing protein [Muribaculaceae bacterium]|nr:DUF4421 domain-containing protein [Muribaculaceae bacterium]